MNILEHVGVVRPSFNREFIEKAGNIPTIYVVGDSTSTDQPGEPKIRPL